MQKLGSLDFLTSAIKQTPTTCRVGRIKSISSNQIEVSGLSEIATVGDCVAFSSDRCPDGEIVAISDDTITVFVDDPTLRLRIGHPVRHLGNFLLFPDDSWIGRVLDGDGNPLDGMPLRTGQAGVNPHRAPPSATSRRALGNRLGTGYAVFDTILPIVRGQRLGLFSGSGVGKSTLMAGFAQSLEADIVVIGLIGERGREVNHFVQKVLGAKGLARSIVIAATSDQSPLARRRAAFSAMGIAEHFRDQGLHVLLMIDSVTRLAEAHREVAVASGEPSLMRGFPPTLVNLLAGFSERAGPGNATQGDITAIFTVLVAGSDMEEPVADTLRGLLDGHVILSRAIAERGRFPAVDILQSVSRSLPEAATNEENAQISDVRKLLSVFEESEIMVRSGLYQPGTNPALDQAVTVQPMLDTFLSKRLDGASSAFAELAKIIQFDQKSGG